MNKDNVDKFLLQHKVEVRDEGFSDRVMQSLPPNVDWQRKMSRRWNISCISVLIFICWQTDILEKLWVDIQVFFSNLPLVLVDERLFSTIGLLVAGLFMLVFIGGKKLASL